MSIFTPRERDILHLVADLRDRAEIQDILGCQLSTLNRHLCQIYDKAEIHSFVKLARHALDNGYGCRLQAIVQETCPIEIKVSEHRKVRKVEPKVVLHVRKRKMSNTLIVERELL
jgi:DNA-binding CsgD family transcriptional regulator